ncbi:MAG: S-layer homology domain-containing protein, partial [Myxococcales bacterium]|nr:S-layer homology domain-containing protein [Myxococcales bacterium]
DITTGENLPDDAAVLVAQISSLDIHTKGGWVELPNSSGTFVIAGDTTKALGRFVLPAEYLHVQSFRVTGDFWLQGPKTDLRVSPNRGVQVNLSNQKLQPGTVNHIHIDLDGAFSRPGPHDWTLDATLPASLEFDTKSFASTQATPDQGGVLKLDDGFEILVPPGALSEPLTLNVERVVGEDGQPYYLGGPHGTQFNTPVTVKYPAGDGFDDPAIAWDAEIITGFYDEFNRIVVQDDHFSCWDNPEENSPVPLRAGALTLFEGHICRNGYSILIVDLTHPKVHLQPISSTLKTIKSVEDECVGKDLYAAEKVVDMLTDAKNLIPGYEAVAALNGDHAGNADGDPLRPDTICFRDLARIDGRQLHPKAIPSHYAIEFEVAQNGNTSLAINDFSPLYWRNGFASGARTMDNYVDDNDGYDDSIFNNESRSSYGFSKDRDFLVMAAADSSGIGDESGVPLRAWRNLLKRDRKVHGDSGPILEIYDLYRSDEGLTPEFAYFPSSASKAAVRGVGSNYWPRGTNLALGVFWRTAPPNVACAEDPAIVPMYTDVPLTSWFHDPVINLMCHGSLDNAVEYRPSENTNRAEYLKALLELAKPNYDFHANVDTADFKKYSDVSPSAWYAPYVKYADDAGLLGFIEESKFNPGASITRKDAAILTAHAGKVGGDERFTAIYTELSDFNPESAIKTYTDVTSPYDDFDRAILLLSNYDGDDENTISDGILCGDGGGSSFSPTKFLNRAEMAKILCRAAGFCHDISCTNG